MNRLQLALVPKLGWLISSTVQLGKHPFPFLKQLVRSLKHLLNIFHRLQTGYCSDRDAKVQRNDRVVHWNNPVLLYLRKVMKWQSDIISQIRNKTKAVHDIYVITLFKKTLFLESYQCINILNCFVASNIHFWNHWSCQSAPLCILYVFTAQFLIKLDISDKELYTTDLLLSAYHTYLMSTMRIFELVYDRMKVIAYSTMRFSITIQQIPQCLTSADIIYSPSIGALSVKKYLNTALHSAHILNTVSSGLAKDSRKKYMVKVGLVSVVDKYLITRPLYYTSGIGKLQFRN